MLLNRLQNIKKILIYCSKVCIALQFHPFKMHTTPRPFAMECESHSNTLILRHFFYQNYIILTVNQIINNYLLCLIIELNTSHALINGL